MIMQLFKKYQQPILYLFFGVCTTAVNIITYYLCAHPLHLSVVASTCIAWVISVLFAYTTNKWWVFESHTLNPAKVWTEFVSFVLCRVATFLFNLAALYVMVDLMKMEFFVCKLVISIVVVVLNYVFSKILIFTGDRKK